MKVPKRLYLVGAALLFVAGAGTVLALRTEEKQNVSIKQTSVEEESPTEDTAELLSESPATEQPISQPVIQETESEPEATVNPFPVGYSGWHTYGRRIEVGMSMSTEHKNERAYCGSVSQSAQPTLHAIACNSTNAHIMFVEQVNADGSIWVSEMNSRGQASISDSTPTGGWNRVDYKLVQPSHMTAFKFVQ
jgi:surface antigen